MYIFWSLEYIGYESIEDQTNLLLSHALQYFQGSADMTGMAETGMAGGPLKFRQIS